MEEKIVIKEVGTIANPQRFANRIEPVDDKEVNIALFSIYDWLIAPVKDIEAHVNKIRNNLSEMEYIKFRSHHLIRKFIIIFIIIFSLLLFPIDRLEDRYQAEYNSSIKLQEEYWGWHDYAEAQNPALYEYINGWDVVKYPAYAAVVIAVILRALEYMNDKHKIKKIKKENKDLEDVIVQKTHAIKKEISFVPPAYRHSRALQYFVESYENSRINNLYEAVNLYDTYEHRKNVEGALMESCSLLQQIAYNQVVEIEQLKALRRDVWVSEALF